jgi:membrane associated rhomboid family serine protease
MLIYWMFLQVVGGLSSVVSERSGGGVAFWAHVGGFVVGLVFVKVFERSDRLRAHMRHAWRPRNARGWY